MDLLFNCEFKGYLVFIGFSSRLFCEIALSSRTGRMEPEYHDFHNLLSQKPTDTNIIRMLLERVPLSESANLFSLNDIKQICELDYSNRAPEEIDAMLSKRTIVNVTRVKKTGELIYTINNVVYSEHFPLHWALSPLKYNISTSDDDYIICGPGTSKTHCSNCNIYGSLRGVFIGYCSNCAIYSYNLTRGYGFCDHGRELVSLEDGKLSYPLYLNIGDFPGGKRYVGEELSAMNTYLARVDLQNIGYGRPDEEICLSGGEVPTGPDICDDQSDMDPFREENDDVPPSPSSKTFVSRRYPRRSYGLPVLFEKQILQTTVSDQMTPDFIRNKIEIFFAANYIEVTDNNYSFPIGKRQEWDDYRVEKRPNYWYAWNAILKKDQSYEEDVIMHMRLYLSAPIVEGTTQTMLLVCNNVSGRNSPYYAMIDTLGRWILDETDSTDIFVSQNSWDIYEAEEEMKQSYERNDGGLFVLILYYFILYFVIVYHMHLFADT